MPKTYLRHARKYAHSIWPHWGLLQPPRLYTSIFVQT
jgi:hypothetical protein